MPDRVLRVTSPHRDYHDVPMVVTMKDIQRPQRGDWAIEDMDSGETLALQSESGWWSKTAWLRFVLPEIRKGETRLYKLREIDKAPIRAQTEDTGGEALSVILDGKEVTRYHFGSNWARPFLWPLAGPDGIPLTRSWPMDENPDETRDHEHHKSVWSAFGDLNGIDIWGEETGHGVVRHESFVERTSGPVFCRFSAKQNWLSAQGNRLLRSYIDLTAYATGADRRILDYTICFRAPGEAVRFGDTKEGGILSLRMTTSMNGDRGGLIENAYGGLTEAECWGKPSPWVDYSGPAGQGVYGVAMFDHPENPRYPTRWHVRDYGLFAANPFALHNYLADDSADGSMTLQPGEIWRFQYRLLLHRGGASEGGVASHYLAYVSPPGVEEEITD